MTLKKEPFKNIVGKEENAGNQHFLPFPQCFLSYPEQILPFGSPSICLQMLSIWTAQKFCRVVKGKEIGHLNHLNLIFIMVYIKITFQDHFAQHGRPDLRSIH